MTAYHYILLFTDTLARWKNATKRSAALELKQSVLLDNHTFAISMASTWDGIVRVSVGQQSPIPRTQSPNAESMLVNVPCVLASLGLSGRDAC
jgi:hypothetical protein